jgi:tyrosyl-tRNA synthetase
LWFGLYIVDLEEVLMNTEEKVQVVSRGLDEVVTVEDLQSLFEVESHPKAYIGVEPSG